LLEIKNRLRTIEAENP